MVPFPGRWRAAKGLSIDDLSRARLPLDETLEDFFAHNPRQRKQMDVYFENPLVRRLLALGKKAEVRFDREVHGMGDRAETLQLFYTVRCDTPQGPKTFSAHLGLEWFPLGKGLANWQMVYAGEGPAGP